MKVTRSNIDTILKSLNLDGTEKSKTLLDSKKKDVRRHSLSTITSKTPLRSSK